MPGFLKHHLLIDACEQIGIALLFFGRYYKKVFKIIGRLV